MVLQWRQRSKAVLVWMLTLLVCGAASAAEPAKRDVQVITSVVPGARLVTVRLDVAVGHGDETHKTAGTSAATSLWLRRGPSVLYAQWEMERVAARAGLTLQADIGWRTTSLSFTGPSELASLAGQLAADRLEPGDAPDEVIHELLQAIWTGHQEDLRGVVGPMGNAVDTAAAALEGGRSAFASRNAAARLSPRAFRELVSQSLLARAVRVVIVGSKAAIESAHGAFNALQPTTYTPPSGPRPGGLSKARRMAHAEALDVHQRSDSQHHLAVAWTLRGVAADGQLTLARQDAALLTLRAWADHPGAQLTRRLVDERGAIHDLSVQLVEQGAPMFIVSARISGGNVPDARHVLLESMAAPTNWPASELGGAQALARADLLARVGDVQGRTELISELISSGRAFDERTVLAWVEAVKGLMSQKESRRDVSLMRSAFVQERRLVVTAKPRRLPRTARLTLGPNALDDFLRVLVHLQCPGPKFPPGQRSLMMAKYGMTQRRYADMTRAIARDRRLMRQLAEDADNRCQELARLRDIMTAERVVVMHEAVACGPGANPATSQGRRKLARVFKRFRVDASWYRPLRGMAWEQPDARLAIEAIDQRCQSPEDSP